MKVIFYTAVCYMDTSVEVINVLKNIVELHVIIEMTAESKNQNIIDVSSLPEGEVFVSPERLLSKTSYNYIKPYLEGTASANFLVYDKNSISATLKRSYKLYKYINKIKPDVLHLEALLIRTLFLLPSFFKFKKIILTVHDPVPHLGERDTKVNLTKFIYFNNPKLAGFIFYSQFAKKQFESYYIKQHAQKWVVKMFPLTYFKNFQGPEVKLKTSILFFGRISPYKGIEVLLKAIPKVLEKFPGEHFVIAGRSINDYKVPEALINGYADHITILNRHISNDELVQLVDNSKFVVCPYIEATQSGVLMTSFALDTPVIATEVGAFTEYVDEDDNGALSPANDHNALAEKMIAFLQNNHYADLAGNIARENTSDSWKVNGDMFLKAYESSDG